MPIYVDFAIPLILTAYVLLLVHLAFSLRGPKRAQFFLKQGVSEHKNTKLKRLPEVDYTGRCH